MTFGKDRRVMLLTLNHSGAGSLEPQTFQSREHSYCIAEAQLALCGGSNRRRCGES